MTKLEARIAKAIAKHHKLNPKLKVRRIYETLERIAFRLRWAERRRAKAK